MKSSASKLIIGCLLLLSMACTKSKDSNGDSNPLPPPTADANGQPTADTNGQPTADETASGGTTPAETTDADLSESANSGNGINFDTPVTQEEIEAIKRQAARFSSAADDSLRQNLIEKADQQPDSVKKANSLKFANMIVTAKLKVSEDKKAFKVVLKVAGAGEKIEKYLSFSGNVTKVEDSRFLRASVTRKIQLKAFNSKGEEFKNQNGTLECLDQSYKTMFDCQTKVATINLNGATAKIILRYSGLNTVTVFPDSKCMSTECDELYNLFYNTEYKIKDVNSLRSAVMETFEVINGRSAFNVLLTTNANEVIKMEGELPAVELSEKEVLDTPLNMKLTSEEAKSRKTRLNKAMHSTFLQTNDGNGGIKIKVRMAMDKETSDFDVFEISFARILNPIKVLK